MRGDPMRFLIGLLVVLAILWFVGIQVHVG